MDDQESDQGSVIKSKLSNSNNVLRTGGGSVKIINESIVNINKIIDNFSADGTDSSEREQTNKSANGRTNASSSFFRDLRLPHIYKPLMFGLIIMFYQQMSGANGLFGSLQLILNSAKLNQLNEQQAAFLGKWIRLWIV